MAQISQIDILSRTLQIIRLMARDEGATVTEISKQTGIARWTVRDMIDRMESFNPDYVLILSGDHISIVVRPSS